MRKFATFATSLTAVCCLTMALLSGIAGCSGGNEENATNSGDKLPVFSLSPSEYPSWSTYMVAAKMGLLNPAAGGEHGKLEKEYGVDIVLKVADYDTCITYYASGEVDAVCITNMDALNPALGRPSTAIMPTSTSNGADAVIAVGVNDVDGLKGTPIYLLTKSVSHITVHEGLKAQGKDPKEFQIAHLDPGAAAQSLQNPDSQVKAICVWNPFALTVLKNNQNAKTIFSSTAIPNFIVDMVVVGDDALKREGGENFAKCLCAIQYEICKAIQNKATERDTVVALGEDFSDLPYADMKKCLEQTKFYMSPTDGSSLFGSAEFQTTMKRVVQSCVEIEVLESKEGTVVAPTISYDGSDAQLKFTTKYMEAVK